jgi:hypothetical protein
LLLAPVPLVARVTDFATSRFHAEGAASLASSLRNCNHPIDAGRNRTESA